MTYELSDGQYFSSGPVEYSRSVPSHQFQNNVPFYMFKPYTYSEPRVLQLLKKGIGQNGYPEPRTGSQKKYRRIAEAVS